MTIFDKMREHIKTISDEELTELMIVTRLLPVMNEDNGLLITQAQYSLLGNEMKRRKLPEYTSIAITSDNHKLKSFHRLLDEGGFTRRIQVPMLEKEKVTLIKVVCPISKAPEVKNICTLVQLEHNHSN